MYTAQRPPLNEDQSTAVEAIVHFLKTYSPEDPFFLLEGYAGVGKTFSIKEVVNRFRGRLVFTAPTNKATKVLRETLTSDEYRPECRTIYSLLGLRLEANGEVKELATPEDPLDLSDFSGIVVDEGSMINSVVFGHIRRCALEQGIPFIFMGDPAQLPPVGEASSPIWNLRNGENYALLTKVMRHDNQILNLVTEIRNVVDLPFPRIQITSDNDGSEGVFALTGGGFQNSIIARADLGEFEQPGAAKVIAWRNVTVDAYNRLIRNRIFSSPKAPWVRGDRLIVTSPAKDLQDEPMAFTDDEGVVTHVAEDYHPLYPEFQVFRLSVTFDDNRLAVMQVLHPSAQAEYDLRVNALAMEARANRKLWGRYWDFKEAFHSVRYGYAITAHRAQGSTYTDVYVDWRDILLNRNKQEAYRCLYVACSRAKHSLTMN